MQPKITTVRPLVAILALLVTCTGCPRDESKTVTLVIDGDSQLAERVHSIVGRFVDTPGKYNGAYSRWFSGPASLRVSPVSDVERFRAKLRFATVTKQNDRTLYLTLDPDKTEAWISMAKTMDSIDAIGELVVRKFELLKFGYPPWRDTTWIYSRVPNN